MNLPNYITLSRIFAVPLFIWILSSHSFGDTHGKRELLASGVFILASITDGIDGLLVPPGDVGALARAMLSLDSDAERATALGGAARERATSSFSPQAHIRGLLGVYREAGAPA